MARPKEFDQERALHRAISIFSQKGFAATSTDDLMRAMDLGRQSMYDTFGNKRALFLKALEVYVSENVRAINVELQAPGVWGRPRESDKNTSKPSRLGFCIALGLRVWAVARSEPPSKLRKREHSMKKLYCLTLALALSASAFAQAPTVVRWKTIVGNITVSNNDAVAGINPGTTPWSTTGGRARV